MSWTMDDSSGVNHHTLHCDQHECPRTYRAGHRYGDVDALRKLAAAQGWTAPAIRRTLERRPRSGWDFCPRHSTTDLAAARAKR